MGLWVVYGGELAVVGEDAYHDLSPIEFVGLFDARQDAYDAWKARSFGTIDNAHRRYQIAEYPDHLPDGVRWSVKEGITSNPALMDLIRRETTRAMIAEDRAGEADEDALLDNIMDADRYAGYQISVGHKIIEIKDATPVQLRIALAEAIDVIEDLEDALDPVRDRIERWRTGAPEPFYKRNVPYFFMEGDTLIRQYNGYRDTGAFIKGEFVAGKTVDGQFIPEDQ